MSMQSQTSTESSKLQPVTSTFQNPNATTRADSCSRPEAQQAMKLHMVLSGSGGQPIISMVPPLATITSHQIPQANPAASNVTVSETEKPSSHKAVPSHASHGLRLSYPQFSGKEKVKKKPRRIPGPKLVTPELIAAADNTIASGHQTDMKLLTLNEQEVDMPNNPTRTTVLDLQKPQTLWKVNPQEPTPSETLMSGSTTKMTTIPTFFSVKPTLKKQSDNTVTPLSHTKPSDEDTKISAVQASTQSQPPPDNSTVTTHNQQIQMIQFQPQIAVAGNNSSNMLQLQQPQTKPDGSQPLQLLQLQPQSKATANQPLQLIQMQPQAKGMANQPLQLLQMQPQAKGAANQPLQYLQFQPQVKTSNQPVQFIQVQQQANTEGNQALQLVQLQPQAKGLSNQPAQLVQMQVNTGSKHVQMLQMHPQSTAEGTQPLQLLQMQPQFKSEGNHPLQLVQLQPQTGIAGINQPLQMVQLQSAPTNTNAENQPLKAVKTQTSVAGSQSLQMLQLQQPQTSLTGAQPVQLLQLQPQTTLGINPGSQPVQLVQLQQHVGATGNTSMQLIQLQQPSTVPGSQPETSKSSLQIQLPAQSPILSGSTPKIQLQPTTSTVPNQLEADVQVRSVAEHHITTYDAQMQVVGSRVSTKFHPLPSPHTKSSQSTVVQKPDVDVSDNNALLKSALQSMLATGSDQDDGTTLQNVQVKMNGLQGQSTMPIILGQNIKLVPDSSVGGMSLTQNLQVAMVPVQKLAALRGVELPAAPVPAAAAPVASTATPIPSPVLREKLSKPVETKTHSIKGKTQKGKVKLTRDVSQPLLLLDVPQDLLKAASESSVPHLNIISSKKLSQPPISGMGKSSREQAGEKSDMDISQFLNNVKNPTELGKAGQDESVNRGQKRTADEAALSPGAVNSVVQAASVNKDKGIRIAAPQNQNLESYYYSNMNNKTKESPVVEAGTDNGNIPCVTYSENILGHKFAPTLLMQKEVEEGEIRVDEACIEVSSTLQDVSCVAMYALQNDGEEKDTVSLDKLGPSTSQKCRIVPMCISGQTFSRKTKKKKRTGDVEKSTDTGEVEIKTEPGVEPSNTTHTSSRNREEGETDGSNEDDVSPIIEIDITGLDGNTEQCAVDAAGNEQRYGCYVCEFIAGTMGDVIRHWMTSHLTEKPYTCPSCTAAFKTSFKAIEHIKSCGMENSVVIQMKLSSVYKEALLFEVEQTPLESLVHDAEAPENIFPEAVVGLDDENNDHINELDDTRFAHVEQQRLIKLLKEVHKGKTGTGYRCRKCGTRTENALQMELHLKQAHLKPRPFGCSSCGKKFVCAFDLKRHDLSEHSSRSTSQDNTQDHHPSSEATEESSQEQSNTWDKAYSCIDLSKTSREYRCKKCDVVTETETGIVKHVVLTHGFVSLLMCKVCKYQFPRSYKFPSHTVKCPSCQVTNFVPTGNTLAYQFTSKSRVFVCRMCEYKSQDKSGMTRHIKYSHTTVRPYMCGYCEYASVEKPKIRIHLYNHHKDLPGKIIRDDEMLESFKKCLPELFDKLTYVFEGSLDELCKLQLRDEDKGEGPFKRIFQPPKRLLPVTKAEQQRRERAERNARPVCVLPRSQGMAKKEKKKRKPLKYVDGSDGMRHTLYIRHVSTTAKGFLMCDLCGFKSKTWAKCAAHVRAKHVDSVLSGKDTSYSQFYQTPYFRCVLCDYKCYDRSCMSRHIKYIHMKVAPHCCPLCSYRKVEKTKVRNHIKSHHPQLADQFQVVTDGELVSRTSKEAKLYYCLVTEDGEEFPYIPPVIGPPPKLLPLRNANIRTPLPPNTPIPQWMVLNLHAATKSAQLADPSSGNILNVNLSGCVKTEDGTMIKIEPGMEGAGSSSQTEGGTGTAMEISSEPQVKSEPENEYPGEKTDPGNDTELEIVKEILKPTGKEQIEVVLAEHADTNSVTTAEVMPGEDKDLAAMLNIYPGGQKVTTEELTEEGEEDEDDMDDSSEDEDYQPDDSDSADEEDIDWNMLVEKIGDSIDDNDDDAEDDDEEGSIDSAGDLDTDIVDMDVDVGNTGASVVVESADTTTTAPNLAGRKCVKSPAKAASDVKLSTLKPVVVMTDIIQQILSGY